MPRPLDPGASRRILAATVELLFERGYGALTLEAVAERAAVSRPTVYRRHAGKRDLCVAAIESLLRPMPAVDGGDHEVRAKAAFASLAATGLQRYVALVGELLALEPDEPELLAAWRRSVLEPRRAPILEVLRQAATDGTLRPGVDPAFVLDSMTGHLLARVWQGRPLDETWVEHTWAQLWSSVT